MHSPKKTLLHNDIMPVLKKAKTFERRKVQRRVVEAKEANAPKPSVPLPEPEKLAAQLEALKNVDLDALAEKVVQKSDLVPQPSQQQLQQQQQQGRIFDKQQPLLGSVEEVLGQRLMRAGCVRKQVEDLKKEFGRRFKQKGSAKGKAGSAQEAAQGSMQPSADGHIDSESGAREQRGAQEPRLKTHHGNDHSSSDASGDGSESGGDGELQSSSSSEDGGEAELQDSMLLGGDGGGLVTGPGGVKIRLRPRGPDNEGRGVSSSKRRRLGSGSGDEDGASESSQGTDEHVADLDGGGAEFGGVLGVESEEDGGGVSSFDSRDYDMPAGGRGVRDGRDTAESSGKSVSEKGSSAGSSKKEKTALRREDRASIGSSTKATVGDRKQHAGKQHGGKEGRGGEDGHNKPHGKAGAKDSSSNARQPAASGAAATASNPGLGAEQLHPSWAAKMLQKQKASLTAPSTAAKKIKFDEGGSIVEEAGPAPQHSTGVAVKDGGAGKGGQAGGPSAGGKMLATEDRAPGNRGGKPPSIRKAFGAHARDLRSGGRAGFIDKKPKHGGKPAGQPGANKPGGQAAGREQVIMEEFRGQIMMGDM
ncbi:hypothetical protein DUNSADRAFT_14869 [Dunaliella salina]|uniref:Uncharacterized protein n=1 Tax=Dunaliella salina TaxID=3046 RepID=A0ABQ7G6K5_DUNSA|nr:hypothetical protein DUNSADRAFT_14869 [Dunaliella salina]|eukprot:KAF5830246.1 hypothetical protein DUNSADRAFT_14869 [Dunaliella salina]